jgi:hypothetical protein
VRSRRDRQGRPDPGRGRPGGPGRQRALPGDVARRGER